MKMRFVVRREREGEAFSAAATASEERVRVMLGMGYDCVEDIFEDVWVFGIWWCCGCCGEIGVVDIALWNEAQCCALFALWCCRVPMI